MGIFSNLFARKKTNEDVYSQYTKKILSVANIKTNDANFLKGVVYLCFVQIACLHSLSSDITKHLIDNMVEDAKNSILSLNMKVSDLAKNKDELDKILNEFPQEANVFEDTRINGLAAWDAIYFGFAEEVIVEISKKGAGGPMGVHGYAAIKFLEALRGETSSNFMEVTMLMQEMTGEVIEALR